MSTVQIAWLGLGNMGRGMVKNLVEKGNLSKPLIIQNRTFARSEKLAATLGKDKVTPVATVEEAVKQADVIFSCLGDDAAIQETIKAATSVDIKGKLFVECSTVAAETTRELAKQVEAKGGSFVASPVFGAPPAADAGQLYFVLAGPKELVQKVIPYTKGVMGKGYLDFSDQDFGKASIVKVLGNSIIFSAIEGLAEALTIGEKSGVGVEPIVEFVQNMFPGPLAAYANRMKSGDYYKREEPLFQVDLARKDARHMLALGKENGVDMAPVKIIDKHFESVKAHMGERGDIAGIYGATRAEAGLPFEN